MAPRIVSLIVPVYKNEGSIPALIAELNALNAQLESCLELVFVVDGSPDLSYLLLKQQLPRAAFRSQLISLSRNFGSFAAIRAGLEAGSGEIFAVMAADLQEPPELIVQFVEVLESGRVDIVLGERVQRGDPFLHRMTSGIFWWLYKKLVHKDLPDGGVDVFACNRLVRDRLLSLGESNCSLIGLLFWVGYRRETVPYIRKKRPFGKSAWTVRRKIVYLLDSFISFTDLPIRLLVYAGLSGLAISILLALVVLAAKLNGTIAVPGYTPTLLVITFFGGLNCFGLGVIGGYVWRTFENTKNRPLYIVHERTSFND